MPHLMNCGHSDDGWCLDCVRELHDSAERLRGINSDLCRKANALTIQSARDAEEIERLRAAPSVPSGEPVAWMAESQTGTVRFTNIGQSADELAALGWSIVPLYAAPQPAPAGWRLLKDTTPIERQWGEDASHENGCYHNTCCQCLRMFVGHKRRVVCKACAAPAAPGGGAGPNA
jgi:hypothetical protein